MERRGDVLGPRKLPETCKTYTSGLLYMNRNSKNELARNSSKRRPTLHAGMCETMPVHKKATIKIWGVWRGIYFGLKLPSSFLHILLFVLSVFPSSFFLLSVLLSFFFFLPFFLCLSFLPLSLSRCLPMVQTILGCILCHEEICNRLLSFPLQQVKRQHNPRVRDTPAGESKWYNWDTGDD